MTDSYLIQGLDHLEFYVGNAKQANTFYAQNLGFTNTGYKGLETGERKVVSYVMEQGKIRFVLSSALNSEHFISQSIGKHGDTIAVVALEVSNVSRVYAQALDAGAISATPPTKQKDQYGMLEFAAIRIFGDTVIKFIDRTHYPDNFAPGFAPRYVTPINSMGLKSVDHTVGNVEQGEMDRWVDILIKALGFELHSHYDDRTISTENSALMSKVLQSASGIIININEPASRQGRSQIQEFLDYHHGPGIQHIGLGTDNIVQTVRQMKQAGIEFLPIPQSYYDELGDWARKIDVPIEFLAELGILIDRDQHGYLLQIFTKPLSDRPTLFFEIIQRKGARGFGAGNFKSLFVAMEREQSLRGNLALL